jgi:hypothetical protein
MKPLLILALMLTAAAPVPSAPTQDKYVPTSIREWESWSDAKQILFVNAFVGVIADKEAPVYNVTPGQIRAWFMQKKAPYNVSEGFTMVMVGTRLLDLQAKSGAADLSRIYIEDVVQWAIDMKFKVHFPS